MANLEKAVLIVVSWMELQMRKYEIELIIKFCDDNVAFSLSMTLEGQYSWIVRDFLLLP